MIECVASPLATEGSLALEKRLSQELSPLCRSMYEQSKEIRARTARRDAIAHP
jgi:hypothetical protein